MFRKTRFIVLSVLVMAISSAVLGQSRQGDFDVPAVSIVPRNTHLSVDEAEKLVNEIPDLVLLDLRTKPEFSKSHLANAMHVDYFSSDFDAMLAKLDQDKTYLVYCTSGARSDEALRRMADLGISNAHIIGGGFRAWKARGKGIVVSQN